MNGLKKTQLINVQVLQKMGIVRPAVLPPPRPKKPEETAAAENDKGSPGRTGAAGEPNANQDGSKSDEKPADAGTQHSRSSSLTKAGTGKNLT